MLRHESCVGPGYKYQTSTIVKHTINPIQVIYFFWLRPPLRSRSRVDLGEFFSKYGCINLVYLHCLSVSTVMVYTSVRMAASIRSTSTACLYVPSWLIPIFVRLHRSSRPPLLVYKYRHGLYLCSYGYIDPVDLHCDSSMS